MVKYEDLANVETENTSAVLIEMEDEPKNKNGINWNFLFCRSAFLVLPRCMALFGRLYVFWPTGGLFFFGPQCSDLFVLFLSAVRKIFSFWCAV